MSNHVKFCVVVLSGLASAITIVVTAPPARGQTQDEVVMLGTEEAIVVDRIGGVLVLQAVGEKIPESSYTAGGVRYEWYMIQDSALGVVFTKPSGLKWNGNNAEFDGDLDLQALEHVHALEIKMVTFNVWREFTGTLNRTRIIDREAGKPISLDPRWDPGGGLPLNRHFTSITFVSRVRFADGRIIEANIDPVLRAAQDVVEGLTLEQLEGQR
jgi:hypothetical protein